MEEIRINIHDFKVLLSLVPFTEPISISTDVYYDSVTYNATFTILAHADYITIDAVLTNPLGQRSYTYHVTQYINTINMLYNVICAIVMKNFNMRDV